MPYPLPDAEADSAMTDDHSNQPLSNRSNLATLATVKHGGCVQLGEGLPTSLEEPRDAAEHVIHCANCGGDYNCGRPMIEAMTTLDLMEKTGCGMWSVNVRAAQAVVDALSAQPSPSSHWDAHELWAMAQLAHGEGIEDGVQRIERVLAALPAQAVDLGPMYAALQAATKSLRTIADSTKDAEFLEIAREIRAYANSRAICAEQAVKDSQAVGNG